MGLLLAEGYWEQHLKLIVENPGIGSDSDDDSDDDDEDQRKPIFIKGDDKDGMENSTTTTKTETSSEKVVVTATTTDDTNNRDRPQGNNHCSPWHPLNNKFSPSTMTYASLQCSIQES